MKNGLTVLKVIHVAVSLKATNDVLKDTPLLILCPSRLKIHIGLEEVLLWLVHLEGEEEKEGSNNHAGLPIWVEAPKTLCHIYRTRNSI